MSIMIFLGENLPLENLWRAADPSTNIERIQNGTV